MARADLPVLMRERSASVAPVEERRLNRTVRLTVPPRLAAPDTSNHDGYLRLCGGDFAARAGWEANTCDEQKLNYQRRPLTTVA